ncbi:MAG: thiamine pyrophosphate-dependent enzyme [Burkholderiaceae bacterium]
MRGPQSAGADGPANLLVAVRVASDARLRGAGVTVVLNDEIHTARLVQKTHTALPSAFASPSAGPIGFVSESRVELLMKPRRTTVPLALDDAAVCDVALVALGLGEDGRVLPTLAGLGYAGAVIEAMGAGHVPVGAVDRVTELASTMPVVLATRVRAGRIYSHTYGFGGSEKELDGWTHEKDPFSLDMIEEQKKEPGNWLHPRQVLRELEKAMPARAMVSTDIGNINSVANSYLRFDEPRSFFAPMSFGNCGYALPTIIGAKCAAMDRPAIAYAGDGAWGMSMVELMTCVRHDIPVTAVVFHNRQWGAEKKNQVDFYNRRFVAGELDNQSFAGIAKAMGAEGVVVDKIEDVGPALKRAVEAQMKDGKTTVIEIMCTRELGDPFRRDALSKPVRFLDKYKDYV